jgi:hypothetical protein
MTRHLARALPLLVLALLLATPALRAQDVQVTAVRIASAHDLLGTPLGVEIAMDVPAAKGVALRISVGSAWDNFHSFGSTCVGLLFPGQELDCEGENRAESSRVLSASVGVPLSRPVGPRVRLSLIPEIRRLWLRSEQVGQRSGRARRATKNVTGLGVGGEVHVQPVAGAPVWLVLGGSLDDFVWYPDEYVADGYAPFEQDLSSARVSLGVSVHRDW